VCYNETPCRAIVNKNVWFCFVFSKIENRKIKQILSGGWYQCKRIGCKERCRRVNAVEILCTHVRKWKNETCRNYSRNRGHEGE
jgi:hypothetical protein